MARDDHSIDDEPIFHERPAPSKDLAAEPAHGGLAGADTFEDRAHHNVWDEPWRSKAGLSVPDHADTYASWYRENLSAVSSLRIWIVPIVLGLLGGPLAILGTLFTRGAFSLSPIFTAVFLAPPVEELMKIMLVMITIERRPYLFRSASVLLAAVVASGLVFAVVENLLYIHFYVDDPTPRFIRWRWTVCTFMHGGATLIAGLGLRRMWRISREDFSKPKMIHAYPYIVAAAVFHGGYNLFTVFYESFAEPF